MTKSIAYPRSLAVKVLTRVLSGHELLDEVLGSVSVDLSPAQAAWLQESTAGTLRWKGKLDFALDSISLKKKPSGWLRKVLLLACYQLVAQDRVHAGLIVSETVSLIREKEGEAPARFANACLRKISDHAVQWKEMPYPEESQRNPGPQGSAEAASWASMPIWLWSRLVQQQGETWARHYAQACLERPVLWARSREEEMAPVPGAEKGPVLGSWRLSGVGKVSDFPSFQQGQWIIQDVSSQLLVTEMAELVKSSLKRKNPAIEQTIRVLDLCASPGGKSITLAWNGLSVIATEKVEKRWALLKESVARAAPHIEVLPWKDLDRLPPLQWVWVDAPCSGTGIIRRHPDVRWLRQEKELASLMKTQKELLLSAMEKVQPGGFVSYSVCSVLKEEGPEMISSLGLEKSVLKTWFLCPQDSPYGDGFWGVLLQKQMVA